MMKDWQDMLDSLNLKKGLFPSSNVFNIPEMRAENFDINKLIPYRVDKKRDGTAHFFLDDYRFERCWNNPLSQLKTLKEYQGVLTPDFSLYLDYPLALQIWQVYRNRWLGCFWQSQGINVIPTIGWSDERSFDFAFLGVQKESPVAIGTVGILKDKTTLKPFLKGFEKMVQTINPSIIIAYGNPIQELESIKNIRWFEPYSSKWKK